MNSSAIFLQRLGVMLTDSEMNALGNALLQIWKSSIGRKWIVALTGIVLVGFLVAHMGGNLLVFQGREALNDYAYFLHHFLHGWGIWAFRLVLLGAFVLHIAATISLVRENRAARDSRYACDATVQAPKSSRIMIWSGLTVLGFVVFHILHFTIPVNPNLAGLKDPLDPTRADVFGMVVKGFQNPLVVVFYIVAVSLLCSHLCHGVASIFQTLGLRTEKTRGAIHKLGLALALVLWLGFLAVPFLVSMGAVKDDLAAKPARPSADQAATAPR